MQGNLIIDLQFGSTGKGLIAGVLAERDKPDTLVTAWAANAGHTYIDANGRSYIHTMLANGIVSPSLKRVLIGPGSLINPVSLRNEIEASPHLMRGVDVLIHPSAAIITPEHAALEAGPMTKIGSTKKGVGEAMIQRIRRDPDNMNVASDGRLAHPSLRALHMDGMVVDGETYQNALDESNVMQVEGAQGYSLSMYHGFYPYTTSRDVSTHQVLADCGIPYNMGMRLTIVGTARAFPIRVANRYDESGKQVGWSGPCYDDQREMHWEELGREAELTTVTKLPRRIFTMSIMQLREACRMCGVDELFLNFVNYCPDAESAKDLIHYVNEALRINMVETTYIGLGPASTDVIDLSEIGSALTTDAEKDEIVARRIDVHYERAAAQTAVA